MTSQQPENTRRWILFFYSVPSKPVNNRMTVWRKLVKAGAVPLKGAVYILPFSEDQYEFTHWLVSEVKEMKGDAAMVAIDRVDSVDDGEIIELFNKARRQEYLPLARDLEEIVRKLNTITKGGQGPNARTLAAQLEKIRKSWTEIQRIDFFATSEGRALNDSLKRLQNELQQVTGPRGEKGQPVVFNRRSAAAYRGRIWATRTRPFVDRMACAWLITRFIDPAASFFFIDDPAATPLPAGAIVFDAAGGEFTHSENLCTFEVMVKAFGLKEKALRQIGAIVHDLDIKDNKYQAAEAQGVEEILKGIRKTVSADHDALAQGMRVFELIYASKKP